MNYFDMVKAQEGLTKLSNEKLNVKDAIKVARLIKKLSEESDVYNSQRQRICEKYGTETDDGGYKIAEDKVQDFNKEMTELLETELENDYEVIVIESDCELTVNELISMESFVTFKE